jgi:hypothetical protein
MHDKDVRLQVHTIVTQFLAWSVQQCMNGVMPTVDFYGNAIESSAAGQPIAHDVESGVSWKAAFVGWKVGLKVHVRTMLCIPMGMSPCTTPC